MRNSQKGSAAVILLAILVVVLAGGLAYFAFLKKPGEVVVSPTPTPTAKVVKTTTPTPDPTADWKTYTDQILGFSIRYPQDWRMAQCGTNCVGLGPQNKPEDTAISINILSHTMPEAKAYLPVLSINNGITEEKLVTIGGVQWTKVTVQQNESGTKFYEYLKEKSGKTIDIGGDGSTTFLQILSTFKFTK